MVADANAEIHEPMRLSDPAREDSNTMWMLRGILVGVLLIGAANALSFFFRSQGWGSLLGNLDPQDEAIGFPLMIWEESTGYGSHALRVVPFVIDLSTALLLGGLIGCAAIWQRATLNRIMQRFRSGSAAKRRGLQFSLRGLLLTTVLAALTAAIVRSFTPRVEVLAAIYALGPAALVVFAFAPRRLSWQQRVAILTPTAVMLIVAAIVLGSVLGIEFDKVMMGIFICWTPQSAIAAVILICWLMAKQWRAIGSASDLGSCGK